MWWENGSRTGVHGRWRSTEREEWARGETVGGDWNGYLCPRIREIKRREARGWQFW